MGRHIVGIVSFLLLIIPGTARGQTGAAPLPQYLELTKLPAVRDDLQLVEFQVEELQKLASMRSMILASALSEIDRLPEKELRVEARDRMLEELTKLETKAYDALLPFQRKRLDQIVRQTTVRAGDATAGLTHKQMVDALGVSEANLQEIRTKATEVDSKLKERLEAIRREIKQAKESARSEVLALLTELQREQYHGLVGEIIDPYEKRPVLLPTSSNSPIK